MHIKAMKKILLLFVLLLIVSGCFAQEVDMSQVSLRSSDRTKPFLGKEVIDSMGTCQTIKAELESIEKQGASAFNTNSSGYNNFIRNYEPQIKIEQKRLSEAYLPQIKAQAEANAEEEYRNLLAKAGHLEQDIMLYKYCDSFRKDEKLNDDLKIYTKELEKYIHDLIAQHSRIIRNNYVGDSNWEKLSKSLVKDLETDKETAIKYLVPILQEKAITVKMNELYSQALTNVLRRYIANVLQKMPSVDSPECFSYIHNLGNGLSNKEHLISYLSQKYFPDRKVLKSNKMKVITWKNPYYFKDEDSWKWLSGEKGNKVQWERVEKHFPVEDSYLIDPGHPEYQIRRMYVRTQHGCEVYAAFDGDVLIGVSNDYAYGIGRVDTEMEHALCFYELEHNQYNLNAQPAYLKDAIRYGLVRFRESDTGGSYSYDSSFDYKKTHKNETVEMAEKYIQQLHLDHQNKIGKGKSIGIYGFRYRRTERIDGTTFRHYIGDDEQIVILQKFVYGNYCTKLLPFSKVSTFNPKDYVINNSFIKQNKVLTCYYVVEKYD